MCTTINLSICPPQNSYTSQIPVYLRVVVVFQLLSLVWLFATPWTAASQAPLSFTISQSLFKVMSTESMIPSNHLIPLLLLYSIFPSIGVFSSVSAHCIRWPKYWLFSFSNSPSNEYSGLISFRTDWFDILAAQGTLKRVFSSTTVQKHCGLEGRAINSLMITMQEAKKLGHILSIPLHST